MEELEIKEGPPMTFKVIIQNFGKTPAKEVFTAVAGHLFSAGEPFVPTYEFPSGTLPHEESKGVMYPSMQTTLETSPANPITPEII